jgi:hypothetical protein
MVHKPVWLSHGQVYGAADQRVFVLTTNQGQSLQQVAST